MASATLIDGQGLRIAVEGCAVRNAHDLTVMSCPVKYRAIGDFHKYYSGSSKAPYLTIFVGGNHEASSHLWELFYGGWVAPNMYYMGAANVVRIGGVRVAGMSGIWKGRDFNKHHHERLPYNSDDIKSIYHVREIDTRKLLLLRSQIDIGVSHDWPRAVERHGNEKLLFRMKPDFEQESKDGTLGNQAAAYVMDRLRPPYWFSAHMHCKFSATKSYESNVHQVTGPVTSSSATRDITSSKLDEVETPGSLAMPHNEDEIDLDLDDDTTPPPTIINSGSAIQNQDEINIEDDEEATSKVSAITSSVPMDIRAQLPAAFSRAPPSQRPTPGQPCPPEVTNHTVRFLALDKCLPSRKFLQLLEILPHGTPKDDSTTAEPSARVKPKFEYDPEWLAITRVFASDIVLGSKTVPVPRDLGESHYRPLIEKEQEWVTENIVKAGKLEIPENFVVTAPIFQDGMPEIVSEGPVEYNNPQMQQFCGLVGIENKFFATDEEKQERMRSGPPPAEERRDGGFGRGRGRGRGGGRGRARGRGRGGRW
ncbi:putative Lariat debranching enzyme [Glarea lozoyensis 74030]|uniref:Putative Lariat debranching enzyme n=1 Tax=Glarea lozoyensis (strain ATCC 74030 / MF5533) TaxID=1104152 RepID=H0EUV7_GLAL7|nr:putative Lariat debranching enzyme [Glarea lozoyensis 74030]